jgi:hypothetical protein
MLIQEFKQLFFNGRRSSGVTALAWLLIISSVMHIHKLIVDVPWYVDAYGYLPPWLIVTRYAFSWLQRCAGILAAIGLLALNDVARKLAILIGTFTILTIYWKHPYVAYKSHAEYLDRQMGPWFYEIGAPAGFKIASYTTAAVILNCALDILFCSILIYFFTRRSVKKQFKPGL